MYGEKSLRGLGLRREVWTRDGNQGAADTWLPSETGMFDRVCAVTCSLPAEGLGGRACVLFLLSHWKLCVTVTRYEAGLFLSGEVEEEIGNNGEPRTACSLQKPIREFMLGLSGNKPN